MKPQRIAYKIAAIECCTGALISRVVFVHDRHRAHVLAAELAQRHEREAGRASRVWSVELATPQEIAAHWWRAFQADTIDRVELDRRLAKLAPPQPDVFKEEV